MSLIGWMFPTVVGLVALAGLVALVLFWPRLAPNRVLTVAARIGGVVGLNVLVVFLAGVLLNAQFLFYASWGDLANSFGGTPAQTTVSRGTAASAAAAASVRSTTGRSITVEPPARLPALPGGANGPNRLTFTVHGRASGITSTVIVSLPPGYRQAPSTSRYPVLETFQGYPGQPGQWLDVLHLDRAVAQAVAQKQMQSALIVSPNTEIPGGRDAECVNGPAGDPQIETWLTTDVPNWIVQHFRVRTQRISWTAVGLSEGGWCAAMATLKHPGTYSAAIVMAGYFEAWFGPYYRPFEPKTPVAQQYNLIRLEHKTPPPVAIWLETSHADRDSYPSSAVFLRSVRAPTAVSATVLQNAGHRMSVWIDLLPQSLRWLGSAVPGFRSIR